MIAVTVSFDSLLAVSLKDRLPWQIHAETIISNIRDLFPTELFTHGRVNSIRHFRGESEDSFSSLISRTITIEDQPHRPFILIRIFVVQRDNLSRGVLGCRVYPIA